MLAQIIDLRLVEVSQIEEHCGWAGRAHGVYGDIGVIALLQGVRNKPILNHHCFDLWLVKDNG